MKNLDLISKKYDRPAPRYTSYPAYPNWQNCPSPSQWINYLQNKSKDKSLSIDLYIHIPYCKSLCLYCGCNRSISRSKDIGEIYTNYLLKEWSLYTKNISNIKISSIHFGGGTPTFLNAQSFQKLFKTLSPYFSNDFEGSIEIDPRVTSIDQIELLSSNAIKRFSLGIQDFNHNVQKAIHRVQPRKMVENILSQLRSNHAKSINFDLIYGLPKQTKATLSETMGIVKELRPDTIALYGYAHVPWKASAQRSLEKYPIAQGQKKLELYQHCKKLLIKEGYKELGLDHFSLEGDALYQSFSKGKMKRSFMGYTTQSTGQLIGLGVSAISSTQYAHIQNEKDIKSYMNKIDLDQFAFSYGHTLTKRDLEVSKAIESIMCGNSVDLELLFQESSKAYIDKINIALEDMQNDKIIELRGTSMQITKRGTPFLRNIAMTLDYRLQSSQRLSKAL